MPSLLRADQAGAPGVALVRLVIDTQTWLDLLWFDDPRTWSLKAALASARIEVVHDEHGLAEWTRLLGYIKLRIPDPERQRLILQFHQCSKPFSHAEGKARSNEPRVPLPRCRDPDDQPFLELARDSAARFLISRDQALLKLDRRCRRIAGFAVVNAEATELRDALA